MRNSSWRWVVGCLVTTVVIVSMWFLMPRRRAAPIVGYQEFMSALSFVHHDDGQPISDVIELEKESGAYLDVSFIPRGTLPQEHKGQPVQDPSIWPLAVRIYPRSEGDAKDPVTIRVQRYQSRKTTIKSDLDKKVPSPVPQGTTGFWQKDRGFSGQPLLSKPVASQEVRLWTFLNPDSVATGEHVYELILYPTARWLSKDRSRSGEPVILQRGIIRLKG